MATQVIPSARTAGPHSQLWPDLKVIATEQEGQAAPPALTQPIWELTEHLDQVSAFFLSPLSINSYKNLFTLPIGLRALKCRIDHGFDDIMGQVFSVVTPSLPPLHQPG